MFVFFWGTHFIFKPTSIVNDFKKFLLFKKKTIPCYSLLKKNEIFHLKKLHWNQKSSPHILLCHNWTFGIYFCIIIPFCVNFLLLPATFAFLHFSVFAFYFQPINIGFAHHRTKFISFCFITLTQNDCSQNIIYLYICVCIRLNWIYF